MKIATLTLPLHPNYGAVLQAYALQKALQELGHDVYSINITRSSLRTLPRNIISSIKRVIKTGKILDNHNYGNPKFATFIKAELNLTKKLYFQKDFYRLDIQNFDAYIVGSDQVWRPKYTIDIKRFFLDFIPNDKIKISYAASFGTEDNEYSIHNINYCKNALKSFKAVSVREKNGIQKCKELFDVLSTHVLDPTLLINSQVYVNLIKKYPSKIPAKKVVCYLLDSNTEKVNIINETFSEPYYINENSDDTNKIGIIEWLKLFYESDTIITDSFHGMVFSIIFQKRFVAIGNNARGLDRFVSLLHQLNLNQHLIIDSNLSKEKLLEKALITPDHNQVQFLLENYRNTSYSFINDNISNYNDKFTSQ
ncbi:TPA: polysaccharide pyruvyl transferase family protein [Providencia rettgeri]|nr:polysaccharide pyruvyl transferase family protein [Providencia rettgeri]